jgi:hypothetical protein
MFLATGEIIIFECYQDRKFCQGKFGILLGFIQEETDTPFFKPGRLALESGKPSQIEHTDFPYFSPISPE